MDFCIEEESVLLEIYFNKSAFESGILDLELMVHASAFEHFPLEEVLLHCLQKLVSWPLL